MKYHDFIAKVQNIADLSNEQDAITATRVTLQTLAERLAGNEPENFAAQLPEELGRFVTESKATKTTENFDLDEFYRRVSERTKSDEKSAQIQARTVMAVLSEALTEGEMKDIKSQLPGDFDPLLTPPNTKQS